MKQIFKDIKSGIVITFIFMVILFMIGTVYSLVNNIWTSPSELEASPGNVLNSEMWNKILSNQNALSGAIANLSATQTFVAPANAVVAFYLETCPNGWKPANGNNNTPDLRGKFIRGLNSFENGNNKLTGNNSDEDGANRVLGSYQIDTIRNMEGEIFGGNYGIIHILPNSASGVLNVGRTLPYSNRYNLQIVVIH